eukprot:SAG31_NODE_1603_length_7767_cov_10.433359_1_plen_86_part_00
MPKLNLVLVAKLVTFTIGKFASWQGTAVYADAYHDKDTTIRTKLLPPPSLPVFPPQNDARRTSRRTVRLVGDGWTCPQFSSGWTL